MNRKEAIKKWETIVTEIENKKTGLDNIIATTQQLNEQVTKSINDMRNRASEISTLAEQVNQKTQAIEQSSLKAIEGEKEIEVKKIEIEKLKLEAVTLSEKNEELRMQLEGELKAGTTSVNLSKSFADKVKEYRITDYLWSGLFILLLSAFIWYYGAVSFSINDVKTLDDVLRHLAFRAPLLTFGIWLAIFFGNRRAESKKLEESYKHKEVMARSFVGYKRTLEELGDEDKSLLKQHMDNLLKAMNENSSKFLNSEGDKHPLFEIIGSCFKSKKKEKEET